MVFQTYKSWEKKKKELYSIADVSLLLYANIVFKAVLKFARIKAVFRKHKIQPNVLCVLICD